MAKSDWSFFENIGGDDETQAKISLQTVPQIKNGKRGKRSLEITWEKGEDGYSSNSGLQGSLALVRETESLVENQGYEGTIWLRLQKSIFAPNEELVDGTTFTLAFDALTNVTDQEGFSGLDENIFFFVPTLFFAKGNDIFDQELEEFKLFDINALINAFSDNIDPYTELVSVFTKDEEILKIDFYSTYELPKGEEKGFYHYGTRVSRASNNGRKLEVLSISEITLEPQEVDYGVFDILDIGPVFGQGRKFKLVIGQNQFDLFNNYEDLSEGVLSAIQIDDLVLRAARPTFTFGTERTIFSLGEPS